MKSIITFLSFFLFLSISHAQLWLVDPLEAIYPDENKLAKFNKNWKADFPEGTVADVHILLQIPIGEDFTLDATLGGKSFGYEVWSQLLDVPVEQNTGLDSRTEQFINEKNPFVIRRAPFRIFEVIQPIHSDKFVSKAKYTAFRLSVPSSAFAQPGSYKVEVNAKSSNWEERGIFTIRIYPILLPPLSESQFFYTNWFNLNQMEEWHKLEPWSESWFNMLNKYAEMMAYGRQNSITIPGELFKLDDNKIILDDTLMLHYINVFRKHGFKYFESPHLMNRGDGDDWGDPELKVALTKRRYYTEDGKADIEELMMLIKNFAYKNNLTSSWLQHIADEPTSVNARCYRDVSSQVKGIFPDIKIMEATNDRDSIVGAIDVWCPLINDFQENESFFREREKQGEKVLVYTCLVPGGPWLNRTLDMEKIRQVYFGWGAAFYNTGGYLHWGLNQYQADPYEQSVVKHPSPVASSNNYLPAGDTHIIYPGEDGPLSSIRFEAHRMGCEDYELLQKLKSENPDLSKQLINKLFRSYTDYDLNLKDYRKTKKKLLKALK